MLAKVAALVVMCFRGLRLMFKWRHDAQDKRILLIPTFRLSVLEMNLFVAGGLKRGYVARSRCASPLGKVANTLLFSYLSLSTRRIYITAKSRILQQNIQFTYTPAFVS